MDRPTPEEIEQRLHQALRGLPSRRAPSSLEQRVLAAIAERQARPWWHQSYAYWPTPVRMLFFVLSAALAAVVVGAAAALLPGVGATAGQPVEATLGWFAQVRATGATLADVGARLLPVVSSTWIYVGLAVFASLYATLIGLGAAAYRVFWLNR
ncbi:hypothetical protein MASR2M8_07790 [Opitutaceae bacterium]